jgi:hypothetical protein
VVPPFGFDPEVEEFTVDEVERYAPERDRVHQALVNLIQTSMPYDMEFEIHPFSGPPLIKAPALAAKDPTKASLK